MPTESSQSQSSNLTPKIHIREGPCDASLKPIPALPHWFLPTAKTWYSIFHLGLVGMLCKLPRFLATSNHNSFEPKLYPKIHLKPISLFAACKHRGEHWFGGMWKMTTHCPSGCFPCVPNMCPWVPHLQQIQCCQGRRLAERCVGMLTTNSCSWQCCGRRKKICRNTSAF